MCVNLLRIFLSGFLFGNLFMIIYSLAGAFSSFFAMLFLKKTGKFSEEGVSMAGGVFHNLGQLALAFFVLRTAGIWIYLPVLMLSGLGSGWLIGGLAGRMLKNRNFCNTFPERRRNHDCLCKRKDRGDNRR